MSNQLEKIKELIDRRTAARLGGGEKAIAKQHEKGKFTARERIAVHTFNICLFCFIVGHIHHAPL